MKKKQSRTRPSAAKPETKLEPALAVAETVASEAKERLRAAKAGVKQARKELKKAKRKLKRLRKRVGASKTRRRAAK
jgi:hypothetical protein